VSWPNPQQAAPAPSSPRGPTCARPGSALGPPSALPPRQPNPPRARVSQLPAQLAARPAQHARARAPAQLPASSPGGRCSPARRRLCAHDRGQPHDKARVARTQRVGSSAPPPAQPGPARQRARPRPLFIFQNRTARTRRAQFLAHAPRLDLAPRLASAVAGARARSAPSSLSFPILPPPPYASAAYPQPLVAPFHFAGETSLSRCPVSRPGGPARDCSLAAQHLTPAICATRLVLAPAPPHRSCGRHAASTVRLLSCPVHVARLAALVPR
jgi:hypothetical protein